MGVHETSASKTKFEYNADYAQGKQEVTSKNLSFLEVTLKMRCCNSRQSSELQLVAISKKIAKIEFFEMPRI